MEYKDHILNGCAIEVLDEEHGKKVIEFWKSVGVDTKENKGKITKKNGGSATCYGIRREGRFTNWDPSAFHTILTLSEAKQRVADAENTYPRVMEVSNGGNWFRRVVFMKKNNAYLAWFGADCARYAEHTSRVKSWQYARPIQTEADHKEQERKDRLESLEKKAEEITAEIRELKVVE